MLPYKGSWCAQIFSWYWSYLKHFRSLFMPEKICSHIILETGLLGSKPVSFPIDQNHQLACDTRSCLPNPDPYRPYSSSFFWWGQILFYGFHYMWIKLVEGSFSKFGHSLTCVFPLSVKVSLHYIWRTIPCFLNATNTLKLIVILFDMWLKTVLFHRLVYQNSGGYFYQEFGVKSNLSFY